MCFAKTPKIPKPTQPQEVKQPDPAQYYQGQDGGGTGGGFGGAGVGGSMLTGPGGVPRDQLSLGRGTRLGD